MKEWDERFMDWFCKIDYSSNPVKWEEALMVEMSAIRRDTEEAYRKVYLWRTVHVSYS